MPKPTLLVTRRLPPAIEARAAAEFDARLSPDDARVTAADILARADGAAAILCCPAEKLDADTIAKLPNSVKVVGTFSVGFDHIDMPALRARGIPLVNTPDVLSVATAECAMLLILAAARRAGEGERLIRARAWDGWAPTQLMGTLVSRPPTRHLWHGPHRPRACPHGRRLRHGRPLPRPATPAARA